MSMHCCVNCKQFIAYFGKEMPLSSFHSDMEYEGCLFATIAKGNVIEGMEAFK